MAHAGDYASVRRDLGKQRNVRKQCGDLQGADAKCRNSFDASARGAEPCRRGEAR